MTDSNPNPWPPSDDPHSGPTLRLVSADDGDAPPETTAARDYGSPSPSWSLSRFCGFVLGQGHFGAEPSYHELLTMACRRFDWLRGTPAVHSIDRSEVQLWVNALKAAGLAPATIDKEFRAVRAILNEAKEYRVRDDPAPGRIKLPPVDDPDPREIPTEHLRAIYAATPTMTLPRIPGVEPSDWWKGWMVYAWNTQVRPEHWLGSKHYRRGWRDGIEWRHIDLAAREAKAPRTIEKKQRRKTYPLHPLVIAHLERLRPTPGWADQLAGLFPDAADDWHQAALRVFPWVDARRGSPLARKTFYRHWHLLQQRAGIPPALDYDPTDIRKTSGTLIVDEFGIEAARYALGHASADLFQRHYDTGRGRRRREVAEAMPQFLDDDTPPDPQGLLFGDMYD